MSEEKSPVNEVREVPVVIVYAKDNTPNYVEPPEKK